MAPIGNTATCSLVGFLLNYFGLATAFHNSLLSVVFLCRVRFNWKPRRIQRVECIGTFTAWVLPLTNRIPAVMGGNVNPTLLSRVCTDAVYPPGCSLDEGTCERGQDAALYRLLFNLQVLIAAVLGIGATILVYCHCRRQLNASRQYDFDETLSREREDLLRKVAFRATFYSLAYLNTFIWPLISAVLAVDYEQNYVSPIPPIPNALFVFNCVSYFLYPSQGVLNYLIYTRYDIRELHEKQYPHESYLQVFWRVWKGETFSRRLRESMQPVPKKGILLEGQDNIEIGVVETNNVAE